MNNKYVEFDVVIYHGNCADGFSAAWVFWNKLKNSKSVQYIPMRYGQDPPKIKGKRVAIVDFSFSKAVLEKMINDSMYLIVLDHHRSAERDLCNLQIKNSLIVFDMERSGAQIAWDYLNPGKKRPWFIEYVADRDLWKLELPMTKEISQALFFDNYFTDFTKLDSLFYSSNKTKDIRNIYERGLVLVEYKDKEVYMFAKAAAKTIFQVDGKKYKVNLAGCPRAYRSDVGNLICSTQECDFAGVYWFDYKNNQWLVSLRAKKESTFDLSEITANLPNGGGHPKAAGFTIYPPNNLSTYFTMQ